MRIAYIELGQWIRYRNCNWKIIKKERDFVYDVIDNAKEPAGSSRRLFLGELKQMLKRREGRLKMKSFLLSSKVF